MAQRTVLWLIDDLTGAEMDDGETVRFGLDGASYEIDLSRDSAAAMRAALASYVSGARRVGRALERPTASEPTPVDNRAVRVWAASNGVAVNPRGRIPASVIDRFRAAGN